jgi:hypothetical protein
LSAAIRSGEKVHQVVPKLLAAVFGFWAATIPTPTSRSNPITVIITIPVQAVIMEDLTEADITAAVLMVVAADTGIELFSHCRFQTHKLIREK